ncbi:MAG: acyl carrier protein, partial [Clostridia bacterium]|nr:acyl carrier protein [Clostridia bacterium]
LDSLDIVEIVTTVENMYGIEIDPIQIDPDNFESVETIWKMIQSIKEEKI